MWFSDMCQSQAKLIDKSLVCLGFLLEFYAINMAGSIFRFDIKIHHIFGVFEIVWLVTTYLSNMNEQSLGYIIYHILVLKKVLFRHFFQADLLNFLF